MNAFVLCGKACGCCAAAVSHPHHDHHCVRVKSGRNCLEEYEGKVGVVEASRDMEKRKKSQEIFSEINVPLFILTNYPSE